MLYGISDGEKKAAENGTGELTISKVGYKPLQMGSVKWYSSGSYAKTLVTQLQSFTVLRFQINNAFTRKWIGKPG